MYHGLVIQCEIPQVNTKIFNENCKGLGTTKKEEETRGDTDGMIILFLIPWYFSVKYQGIMEQYCRPICVSSCFFSFLSFLIPCNFH